MEFIGKGFLLHEGTYKSKNEDGSFTEKFKYSFLVGDQESDGFFIENARVETFVSEKPILTGSKFMMPVRVAVSIARFKQKVNGQYVDVDRPVYRLVGSMVK